MGAAGDMLASALVGLFENGEETVKELNALSLPDTQISYGEKEQNGVLGVQLGINVAGETETPDFHHHHHHSHRSLGEVLEIVDSLNADEKTKSDVKNIYNIKKILMSV